MKKWNVINIWIFCQGKICIYLYVKNIDSQVSVIFHMKLDLARMLKLYVFATWWRRDMETHYEILVTLLWGELDAPTVGQ